VSGNAAKKVGATRRGEKPFLELLEGKYNGLERETAVQSISTGDNIRGMEIGRPPCELAGRTTIYSWNQEEQRGLRVPPPEKGRVTENFEIAKTKITTRQGPEGSKGRSEKGKKGWTFSSRFALDRLCAGDRGGEKDWIQMKSNPIIGGILRLIMQFVEDGSG